MLSSCGAIPKPLEGDCHDIGGKFQGMVKVAVPVPMTMWLAVALRLLLLEQEVMVWSCTGYPKQDLWHAKAWFSRAGGSSDTNMFLCVWLMSTC